MATTSDHTPAIYGAAQITQRVEDPHKAMEPIALIEAALRAAADDAGGGREVLAALDAVIIPRGVWSFRKGAGPSALLAERIGAAHARAGTAVFAGTSVHQSLEWACSEIAAGRAELVAIAGGECERSKRRAKRQGTDLGWTDVKTVEPAFTVGSEASEAMVKREVAIGMLSAAHGFALGETSLRRALGENPRAHRERIASVWARFSDVAAENPHAWIQRRVPAHEIAERSEANRVIALPYLKLMTANMVVDQGAALIVASAAAARRFGLDAARAIHPQASASSTHVVPLSERIALHEHPGQALATQRSLELAGLSPGDLDAIDLYSCFPLAVQQGARALGLAAEHGEPPLTVTGGLTFSGGPMNNYVIQALAATVERLRARPGRALVTSIGGFFAKFGAVVLANEAPPDGAPRSSDVSPEIAQLATRPALDAHGGPVEVESYTLAGGRKGPERLLFATLTERGERVWARSEDPALFDAVLADEDLGGLRGRIGDDSTLQLD